MDITYRGTGAWGPGKGANLQPAEVDTNFWNIAQAIVDLESNPAQPVGIDSITMSGSSMTIHLTDGSTMGPFLIPVLTFVWRGEWQPSTSYSELDVFTVFAEGIFMVLVPHTSDTFFDGAFTVGGAPAYLQLFGSVNATLSGLPDVTLTDPQQGDFLTLSSLGFWINVALGSMAYQSYDDVSIVGGHISGMPTPVNPTDVATKAYVDSLPTGASAPDNTMMANISGSTAPAIPNTLSDFFDSALGATTRGTLIYRSDAGWVALPPGTSGYFLKTLGAGLDPVWEVAGSGVTSITAGSGINTGGAPITATGTVSLASIADDTILANVSGSSAPPTAQTLTQLLDGILTNARGTLLTRMSAGWVGLAPGTNGYFLRTNGAGADVAWDAPAGSGTVTSVATGAGLTGGPITGTGTVALAAIANLSLLANISGSSAAPSATTISLLLDAAISAVQGSVVYRSNTAWVALAPGTSGQFLSTGGAAANPSWQNAPITGSSTPNLRIVSNISGSTAVPSGNTLSNILDAIISSARGTLLYRTNSGWTGLAPGTLGQVLQTGGTAGDPSWATNGGSSIAISSPAARDILVYNSSSGKFENVRPRYEIGCYVPGTMSASQNLLFHKFSKAVTLPANLGAHLNHNTVAGGSVAATGSTAITLARALSVTPTTFATVATLTIAAGQVTASLSTQAAIAFAQGDVLRVRGPTTADTTFADFHLSLVGFET